MIENQNELVNQSLNILKNLNFDAPLFCDHICYRVTSNEHYEALKLEILETCDFVHEANVRGRKISIWKYKTPLKIAGLEIKSLELPAPKKGSPYKEGYEHLEFVITNLDHFIAANPEIKFDHSGMNRDFNRELALQVSEEFQVKFHEWDILDVVRIEKEKGITEVK